MKKAWIGVLDCNNFFVSCERLFRPDLLGKPVVVLSSNDGCVVARSQEVKDMYVPMGVPYFKVKDILEKAGTTTFSSHFALYRDVSRRVFSVMREELDLVEQYSVDEAFFQITDSPEAVATRLKKRVEQVVGIPVSVGIARTKTQAKYASNKAKKQDGLCVLGESAWNAEVANIPLSSIWGVGGKSEVKYKQLNLLSVADLLIVDKARVSQVFGVSGLRLLQELSGEVVHKVDNRADAQKSIMSSRSFRKATSSCDVVADAVAYHVRHAVADLRAMGMKTAHIQVSARPSRYGDFMLRGGQAEAVLVSPTNDSIELLNVASDLLVKVFESGVPYQKVGVLLSGLVPEGESQSSLFSENKKSLGGLMSVIDGLNSRKGKELVLLGSRLRSDSWKTRSDTVSPAYTTQWTDLPQVSADKRNRH